MATFGGITTFTYADNPLRMRGHIETYPSNVKSEGIPNQDGSTSVSFTMAGYRAKASFEDSKQGQATPQPWDAILKGGPYNITVVEQQTNVTHMWTNANFTGDVHVDREKGLVDGLEIIADTYQTMNAG